MTLTPSLLEKISLFLTLGFQINPLPPFRNFSLLKLFFLMASLIFPLLSNSKKLTFQKDPTCRFWVKAYLSQNIQYQAKWIAGFYIVKPGKSFCLALYFGDGIHWWIYGDIFFWYFPFKTTVARGWSFQGLNCRTIFWTVKKIPID